MFQSSSVTTVPLCVDCTWSGITLTLINCDIQYLRYMVLIWYLFAFSSKIPGYPLLSFCYPLLHSDLLLLQAFTVIVLLKIIILATTLFIKEEAWVFLQFGSGRVLSSSVSWWCVPPVTRSGLLQALLILLCCFLSKCPLEDVCFSPLFGHCAVLQVEFSREGPGDFLLFVSWLFPDWLFVWSVCWNCRCFGASLHFPHGPNPSMLADL